MLHVTQNATALRSRSTRQALHRTPVHLRRADQLRCRTTNNGVTAESSKAAVTPPRTDATAIVDRILESIRDTDSGAAISPEKRAEVDELLEQLEQIGAAQQPRPLDNPLLWGNYNVAYTSSGKGQYGEPAGGRFRGRVGKALFRTAGLFQSVLQPDIATNKVEFKLFGFIPGFVGLRGKVLPEGDEGDTVQVLFEPPVLTIGEGLHLRIGRTSSVVLSTTYLDERVRLGKGSRGSLFVFTRGGAADAAGMDRVGLQTTSLTSAALFSAFFVSLFLGGAALWVSGMVALKAAALCLWLLGAAIGGVVRQGGLLMDRDDERMAEALAAELKRTRKREAEREAAGAGAGSSNGNGSGSGPAAPAVALKAAALCLWLLGAAIGGVVRQGGLLMDRDDERMAEALAAELKRTRKREAEREAAGAGAGSSNGNGSGSGPAAPAVA
ncbi:hypothetical protein HYH03_010178 [Edaphochlamys debaryana]|uniref:Plastid lipid-associated protein/fibrillin conserved domain-containing protein n=1 Tax=Edaphochlamys debaryana TaxID=47281 RepID=A0A835XUG7_9CHLO|nr:hypothetical protein HYH03_010178 [Edaphochlamys debaryana]|eukprot:KAG2491387.1 hypothetical protein HYH03_010178 [Edaphochlamys debaryana]